VAKRKFILEGEEPIEDKNGERRDSVPHPILLFLCPIESLYCYFCGFILLLLGRLDYIVTP